MNYLRRLKMWVLVSVISATLLLAEAHNSTDPRCDGKEIEELDNINRYNRAAAKLYRTHVNYTWLGIRWSVKDSDAVDVCSFTVHVWKSSKLEKALLARNSHNASTRNWIIDELEPGTKYEIVVETIYATKHQPLSWTLQTNTMGYGPDQSCNCGQWGTKNGTRNRCDQYSGQCDCKLNTFGLKCDQCDDGFYMHEPYGCVVCDQCPPAKYGGNGSCVFAPESRTKCICLEGYEGNHCEKCRLDYYSTIATEPADEVHPEMKYVVCTKCDCSKNENKSEVLACFERTGDCKACTFLTTGPICDYCLIGYEDKSLNKTCLAMIGIRPSNSAVVAVCTVAIIVCVGVVLFLLYRRRRRNQRILRFFEQQWEDYHDDVKFSNMMEEQEINFDKAPPPQINQ